MDIDYFIYNNFNNFTLQIPSSELTWFTKSNDYVKPLLNNLVHTPLCLEKVKVAFFENNLLVFTLANFYKQLYLIIICIHCIALHAYTAYYL